MLEETARIRHRVRAWSHRKGLPWGGCFVFVMGAMLALALAAAVAGLLGIGCVIAAIAVSVVLYCQREKRAANGESLGAVVAIPIVLFCVGAPLVMFAVWLFFMPA